MHSTASSAGQHLRDEGTARVIENSPADYRAAAIAAVDLLIATRRAFTADEVHDLIPNDLTPHSPNVVPAIIGSRARTGQIVSMGRARTNRASRHASKNQVWRAA
ncbi:hypothetical protein [Dietzia sp. ANT_WB102]|uniref:hypothetical protein n=1 Tax=Dietzia sp. ANT_WB102 TaxID=2597345 RepID=UPI0011EC4CB9|nr:hypothetical protein [Dietzia sp. ANT_WB102]KAA0916430.1 hypothetical protein FQ137_14495 [Dietzia sp. ANT_WB102]